MQALTHALPVLLNLGIAGLVFCLGLAARPSDLGFFWRRPATLARAIVAIDVIVPVAAVLLLLLFEPGRAAAVGILAMAVSPGAPFAPQKELKLGGRLPYVYSLLVVVTLFGLVSIPATLAGVGAVFSAERNLWIAPREIAWIVFLMLILPLAAGMAARRWLPRLAERAARPLSIAVNVLLGLIFLLILVRAFPAMLGLGARSFATMFLVTVVAVVGGHLLGGPLCEDRTALALAAALRHPGLALLVAKLDFPGEEVAAVVLAHLVVSSLATLPYIAWAKRRKADGDEQAAAAPHGVHGA